MRSIEPGRLCIKLRGRDAGKKCVIKEIIDHNFVEIISSGRKKPRRANISHLELLDQVIDISDEKAVKKSLS